MNNFPVTSSVLSAAYLMPWLQSAYDIGAVSDCRLLRSGINDTYLATSSTGKYVLRIYSLGWRSTTEISEEIRLLSLLRDNDISISYALQDAKDEYIQLLHAPEGARYAVLFSYAEGHKMQQYDTAIHYKIGGIMAKLHKITQHVQLERVTYTPETLLIDSLKQISMRLPEDTEEMSFLRGAQAQLLAQFSTFDLSGLRKGAVHLDIWFDNLNITPDNKVTIFDFDFCGNGWLCLDLAYYLMQLYSIEKDEAICAEKTRAFIDGYRGIMPISNEEMRAIPMLGTCLYFFYLGVQCSRFENFTNVFLNENYLKRYINLVLKKYFDHEEEMFTFLTAQG